MPFRLLHAFALSALLLVCLPFQAAAQGSSKSPYQIPDDKLDPGRSIAQPRIESTLHQPLPEQYIWTAEDGIKDNILARHSGMRREEELGQHYFRRDFTLDQVPSMATLYVSGPRAAKIWVNGTQVLQVESNLDSPLPSHVFAAEVVKQLQVGRNSIAGCPMSQDGGLCSGCPTSRC